MTRRLSALALVGCSVVGVLVFGWPFLGGSLPGAGQTSAIALATIAALVAMEVAGRRLDSRSLALLAALAALDAAARAVVITGIGGFSPIFLLILCGGYIFGAEYGFVLGAVSLLVSALVTGTLGPWIPYQLFAVGWVGAVAGLVGSRRRGRPTIVDVAVLAITGAALGYAFGAAMDIWNWTFFQSSPGIGFHQGMPVGTALHHFWRYYVTTSFVYDSFRAVGNAVMVSALGLPVLLALGRVRSRFSAEIVPVHDQPEAAETAAA